MRLFRRRNAVVDNTDDPAQLTGLRYDQQQRRGGKEPHFLGQQHQQNNDNFDTISIATAPTPIPGSMSECGSMMGSPKSMKKLSTGRNFDMLKKT